MTGRTKRDSFEAHRTTVLNAELVLADVSVGFPIGGTLALAVEDVSLAVEPGEQLGIVGESGSGKSVLARTIMGVLPRHAVVDPASSIRFGDLDLRRLPRRVGRHFWGPQIAIVLQDAMSSLNPVKKIGTQIVDPLRYHFGMTRAEATNRALELLAEVGIPDPRRRLGQYPHEASGGMRQRVMIAIAIACNPRVLIADEPTTALDVTVQAQILDLLASLSRDRHMSLVLISHDLSVVANHTDRVAVMYAGQVVEEGPTALVFEHPRHPYTLALLGSRPSLESAPHTRLATIPGQPSSIADRPAGCRFAPRCDRARPDCHLSMPPDEESRTSGRFRCFYPIDDGVPG